MNILIRIYCTHKSLDLIQMIPRFLDLKYSINKSNMSLIGFKLLLNFSRHFDMTIFLCIFVIIKMYESYCRQRLITNSDKAKNSQLYYDITLIDQ